MGSSGSGWLFDQLKYHPDFWMPPIKEFGYLLSREGGLSDVKLERYNAILENTKRISKRANRRPDDTRDREFLREAIASRGQAMDIERYVSFFRFKEGALAGEITPAYARLDGAIVAQLAQRLPEVKIVLLVRDPLERAWSRITKRHRKGLIERKVLEKENDFLGFLESRKMGEAWFPSRIVACWKEHAPNLSFRHYLFDDIAQHPEKTRSAILSYIGGDPDKASGELSAGHNRKAGSEKIDPTDSVRAELIAYFRDELIACADIFGGAATEWPKRYGL